MLDPLLVYKTVVLKIIPHLDLYEHKIVNIFLPFSFNICFGCCLIMAVLLSTQTYTQNICFG